MKDLGGKKREPDLKSLKSDFVGGVYWGIVCVLLTEVVFKKKKKKDPALQVQHHNLFKWSIKHPEIIYQWIILMLQL